MYSFISVFIYHIYVHGYHRYISVDFEKRRNSPRWTSWAPCASSLIPSNPAARDRRRVFRVPWDPWSVESRWIGQDGLRDVGSDVASLCLFSVKSVAAEFLAIYHLNVFRHNGISVKAWYFAHNIAPSAARDICL